MRIETERGDIEYRQLGSTEIYKWFHSNRRIPSHFAKAIFPVEYNLIIARMSIAQDLFRDSPMAKKIAKLNTDTIEDAIKDAECEIRWGARKEPVT